ncbi:cytochrome c [Roseococcus sp. SDR]|uniref:c-type cytochrome n=1 Tax=Roseococcus sp. SDR TaxID=2835532 RepID=UPI001BD0C123|nr:cytochrome c [Roseococcus sp. SDR]MBS7791870.1 cytochrome c [Roseococcus sp. SDR]MBV1847184.1 cytochrome c [Roseococcus sp. SDR]
MKHWLAGLGAVALMGAAPVLEAMAQPSPAAVVTQRREGFKAAGDNMTAVAAVARAGGDPRGTVERIAAIQAWFATAGTMFPAGTQQGAPGLDTRALPAIWTDRAGFDAAMAAMQPRLVALREAAASGNVANFQAAVQATGAACGDCHRPYRAR